MKFILFLLFSVNAFAANIDLTAGGSATIQPGSEATTVTCMAQSSASKCECRAVFDGYFDYYSYVYLDGQFMYKVGFIFREQADAIRACKEQIATDSLCK